MTHDDPLRPALVTLKLDLDGNVRRSYFKPEALTMVMDSPEGEPDFYLPRVVIDGQTYALSNREAEKAKLILRGVYED